MYIHLYNIYIYVYIYVYYICILYMYIIYIQLYTGFSILSRSHPVRDFNWLLYLLSWASCWSASRNKCLANLRIRNITQIDCESDSEWQFAPAGCPGCPECPALTKYYGCVKASGSDFGVARAFPASPFSFERQCNKPFELPQLPLPLPQVAFVQSSEGSCNLANPLAKCLTKLHIQSQIKSTV